MHFTLQGYPASFKMLRQDLIKKAIEIANSLLFNDFNEQVAEQVAISSAKLTGGSSSSSRVHLVPHPKGWAIVSGDASIVYSLDSSKSNAMVKARAKAKTEKLRLYIHSLEGNISDSESFVVNSPAQRSVIWQEEFLEQHIPGPAEMVQERTREAIRKARSFAQKVQSELSIKNSSSDRQSQLSLDY